MLRSGFIFLMMVAGISFFALDAFGGEGIPTKVVVRVVSGDAKVIGTSVGGAEVSILNAETGEILSSGKQQGGTGDTDRIMVQPRGRGKTVYGTPGTALFLAEIPLTGPTRVEIRVAAPLAYPQAIQKGSKTLTLIPGKDLVGEGVVIELQGLIVNVLAPAVGGALAKGQEVQVKAEVKML